MKIQNSIVVICITLLLVLASCTTTSKATVTNSQNTTATQLNIDNVTECTSDAIAFFFEKNFGVKLDSTFATTSCHYRFGGYGGAYEYAVVIDSKTHASVIFSGMGSGGHGGYTYCFESENNDYFKQVINDACPKMKHAIINNEICDLKPLNATTEVQNACNQGFFTYKNNDTQAFAYTQYMNRCGYQIHITKPACTTFDVDYNASSTKLSKLINKTNIG